MRKKRKLIKIILAVVLIFTIGFGCYYTFAIAKNDYRFKKDSFSSTILPKEFNGFTIGFLSDLNLKDADDLSRLKDITEELNQKDLDMIIFGGDIFDSTPFENEQISQILKNINSHYGKFAVMGEKDQVDSTTNQNILTEAGFEVLHNEYRKIYYQGKAISLFGLENNGDISSLINDENKNSFKLVIVHQPDYFDDVKKNSVQLQLSGHTLGGYIKLPIIGGLEEKDHGSRYVSGKHTDQDTTLLISNGVHNESDKSIRFLTFNEINIVTLKHE